MPVLLGERAYDRLSSAVRWVEDERTVIPADPAIIEKVEPVWVKVTSGTADASGDYPGVVSLYRAYDHTWEDLTAAVRVRGIAGETLSNATRYASRPAGVTAGGEDLYVRLGSGGTITCKNEDLSLTMAGVDTIVAYQDDGVYFTYSTFLPGSIADLRLSGANRIQNGTVTTGNQSWSGTKGADGFTVYKPGDPSLGISMYTDGFGRFFISRIGTDVALHAGYWVYGTSGGARGGRTEDVYITGGSGFVYRLMFAGGVFDGYQVFGGPVTGFTGVLG